MLKKCLPKLLLCIALAGCSGPTENFALISTHNVDPSTPISNGKTVKNIKGVDRKHLIFFIPTGTPQLQNAVKDALKNSNADVLTNVNVSRSFWWIPYIYGQSKITVEGDAVVFDKK